MTDIRPPAVEDLDAFYLLLSQMLGFPPPDEARMELQRKYTDVSRQLAVFDGDRIVATSGSYLFELTLPGLTTVPAAGVTAVSTATTHRRRGLLNQMMRRLLEEARDRAEPAAILLASEGTIYPRFGFGVATQCWDVEINARLAEPVGTLDRGSVRMITPDEADDLLPKVFDLVRRSRPGQVDRSHGYWAFMAHERKPADMCVVYDGPSGEVEGYVRYRTDMKWDGIAMHTVNVQEFSTATTDATVGLWHYLLTIDLAAKISVSWRPVDDPVRWMITDPRLAKTTHDGDMLWLCPLDVPKLLSTRTYATDVDLVLSVTDPFLGNDQTVRVRGGSDGASAEPAKGATPDLSMGSAQLGNILLGGVSPAQLVAAGRIDEHTEGAAELATRAFAATPAAWCNTGF